MRSKEVREKGVYQVLDWVEAKTPNSIKVFWNCVFRDHLLQQYPTLRLLRNHLLDGSFTFYEKLPKNVEKEEEDKKKASAEGEEEEKEKEEEEEEKEEEDKKKASEEVEEEKTRRKNSKQKERSGVLRRSSPAHPPSPIPVRRGKSRIRPTVSPRIHAAFWERGGLESKKSKVPL
ncbi:uncharacterized protein C53C9.2-like [Oncorhynchus kisutch]|uniref:uncharacterized protein C53C9.2-like n=1 Tax=Oncorhynchus kisutch TaxID=8019 RepID=UPI0012DC4231|nr:uncharacterized protein C53C9.2-like [Oncorhynchus kisutch]